MVELSELDLSRIARGFTYLHFQFLKIIICLSFKLSRVSLVNLDWQTIM